MTNKEKYAQQMIAAGVCDERGAAFCATAKQLPDGSFGMVLLGVKGHDLLIYDTDMKSTPKELLYTIPLAEVSDFAAVKNMLVEMFKGYSFRFTYKEFPYVFKNCAQNQAAIAVIASEIG